MSMYVVRSFLREEVRLALMDLAELPLKLTRVWMCGFPWVDSIEN